MRWMKTASGPITMIVPALSLIMTLFVGCNDKETLTSSWTEQPLVIDGKLDDWQGKATSYFEQQQAVIGLSNDAGYLYIHFRTKDAKWASLIRRTGLTIYVDNEGGKKKRFFIKLLDGPSMDALRAQGETDTTRSQGDRPPQFQDRMRFGDGPERKRLTCFVKDRIVEMPIAFDGSMGPRAAYDTCWGFYSYEFAIPLRESAVRYYGIDAEPGRKISIGAVWGDMSEMRDPMRENMGAKRGGGMPPGGGGGKGGGMRPGDGRPGMQIPEKQEIWFKTTLASLADAELSTQK